MVARPSDTVSAWRPAVPGVTEVLHAHFTAHAYPMHAHGSWTLLIVDDGAVRYDLDRHERGALTDLVTLLPPYVPHNGRSATESGFRKRVVYLDRDVFDDGMIGTTVDTPAVTDTALRRRIDALHRTLARPGEEFAAESGLALILDRLQRHFGRPIEAPARRGLAEQIRDLLDARISDGITLQQAATMLHSHPTHLVRAFTRRYGMAPHQYLTSRRVDVARRLLLDGQPAHTVAVTAGFYDQSHLSRHFKRIVGTNPGRFAAVS